ncbi:MAG: alpha-1,6-glucosidase domain-containing protein [Pseudomarimonas sp.]
MNAVRAWLALGLFASACTVSAQDPALRAACDANSHAQTLSPVPSQSNLDARALWLNRSTIRWPRSDSNGRFRLYHSASAQIVHRIGQVVSGADGFIALTVMPTAPTIPDAARFSHIPTGVVLAVRSTDLAALDAAQRGQVVLVQEDNSGNVRAVTAAQIAGALDDRYATAADSPALGVQIGSTSEFRLWAPTASQVSLCLFDSDSSAASAVLGMTRDDATGIWKTNADGDLRGQYYSYLVDVHVANVGIVRNRVTDPYSISLGADSRRSYIADLNDPALKPAGWDNKPRLNKVVAATDMVIYELHVRDFSANDASVSGAHRGKYLAFSERDSLGMQHLAALSKAGLTDVHLLPVFDLATVPEINCVTPSPTGAADSESQQAAVNAVRGTDCFNWGYDPWHYTAPEGSYASDARDGNKRIIEFRQMVQSLHEIGLRVGMDVVYNHTSAGGQDLKSVLDRVVPGYYHRLSGTGSIETSTCCSNTATEHRMMARLMIDSAVVWARDYHIDSFRFDLMGHQPRAAMEVLQAEVNSATGRHVELLGEGWNFGEVADGQRFVQASQLSLNGSGIATFSDRARDAARGGGCCDNGGDLLSKQGYVNGLHYLPNTQAQGRTTATDLLRAADMIRVGLSGSMRTYSMQDHRGQTLRLEQIDYAGQPAGFVSQPNEVVNYVENHDNQTLFDIQAFKLPVTTSREDRARTQILAASVVAFSQGIAYYHAGIEVLRSKSMDRNSFDSGDWFNRIDWSLQDNYFGTGLPPQSDNGSNWNLMRPALANTAIKPTPAQIRWTRDAFLDLLKIRASSTLFRLRTAADVQQRLRFLNTGAAQIATVQVGHLNGVGYPGAGFSELLYFINVDPDARTMVLPSEAGKAYRLHPVQRSKYAADSRPLREATYDAATGTFTLPARSALVFVVEAGAS